MTNAKLKLILNVQIILLGDQTMSLDHSNAFQVSCKKNMSCGIFSSKIKPTIRSDDYA